MLLKKDVLVMIYIKYIKIITLGFIKQYCECYQKIDDNNIMLIFFLCMITVSTQEINST